MLSSGTWISPLLTISAGPQRPAPVGSNTVGLSAAVGSCFGPNACGLSVSPLSPVWLCGTVGRPAAPGSGGAGTGGATFSSPAAKPGAPHQSRHGLHTVHGLGHMASGCVQWWEGNRAGVLSNHRDRLVRCETADATFTVCSDCFPDYSFQWYCLNVCSLPVAAIIMFSLTVHPVGHLIFIPSV